MGITRFGHEGQAAGVLFSFPNPVNDVAARLVATGVLVMAS